MTLCHFDISMTLRHYEAASRTQVNLSGGVRVEEVEGGYDARVASQVLEAARHVGLTLQLGHPHSPGPAVGEAGVQEEAQLGHVASLEVQQDVLARVKPAEARHCRVASPTEASLGGQTRERREESVVT